MPSHHMFTTKTKRRKEKCVFSSTDEIALGLFPGVAEAVRGKEIIRGLDEKGWNRLIYCFKERSSLKTRGKISIA